MIYPHYLYDLPVDRDRCIGRPVYTLNVFGPNCPNFDSKTFQEVVRFL